MVQYDEVMMLFIGVVALVIMVGHRAYLKRVRHWKLLVVGFGLIWVGWLATNLEHVALAEVGNYVEHGATALGALSISVCAWMRVRAGSEEA